MFLTDLMQFTGGKEVKRSNEGLQPAYSNHGCGVGAVACLRLEGKEEVVALLQLDKQTLVFRADPQLRLTRENDLEVCSRL